MATSTSNPWEKIEIPEICLFNLHSRACHGSIFKEREECTKYFPFISILTVWNVKITLSQRNPHHCTPVSVKRDQHLVAQNYLRGMELLLAKLPSVHSEICQLWLFMKSLVEPINGSILPCVLKVTLSHPNSYQVLHSCFWKEASVE